MKEKWDMVVGGGGGVLDEIEKGRVGLEKVK